MSKQKLEWWNSDSRVRQIWQFIHVAEHITDRRVLDVGCNTLHFTRQCVDNRARKVVGLDRTDRYPPAKHEQFDWIVQDFFEYEPSDAFDTALCLGVLYHVERQVDMMIRLAELAPVVYLETMVSDSGSSNQVTCVKREDHLTWVPSPNRVRSLCHLAGFEIVREKWQKHGYRKRYELKRAFDIPE